MCNLHELVRLEPFSISNIYKHLKSHHPFCTIRNSKQYHQITRHKGGKNMRRYFVFVCQQMKGTLKRRLAEEWQRGKKRFPQRCSGSRGALKRHTHVSGNDGRRNGANWFSCRPPNNLLRKNTQISWKNSIRPRKS